MSAIAKHLKICARNIHQKKEGKQQQKKKRGSETQETNFYIRNPS